MPVGSGGGVHSVGVRGRRKYAMDPAATTHGHFVLSPVSLTSRDLDGGRRTQRSAFTISRKNRGTVNSLQSKPHFVVHESLDL